MVYFHFLSIPHINRPSYKLGAAQATGHTRLRNSTAKGVAPVVKAYHAASKAPARQKEASLYLYAEAT